MASASGDAAAAPPLPPGDEELVAVPAALLKAMQEALRQQQQREQQEQQQQQETVEQVEAEMMGLRAADYPHVAALTASLLRHSVHDGKPRPKNPISLIYDAADALYVKINLTYEQLGDRQFVASVSAAPDPPVVTGKKYRASISSGTAAGPVPGTQEAADAFGRATGTGCNKRDARNAAAAVLLEGMLRGAPGIITRVWGPVLSMYPLRPQDWEEAEPPSSSAVAAEAAAVAEAAGQARAMAAAQGAAVAAAAAAAAGSAAAAPPGAGPGSEGRRDDEADRARRQHLKVRRVEEREYERSRKEEEREEQRRREEAEWRDRANGPPHEQLQRQARGVSPQAGVRRGSNGGGGSGSEPAPAAVQLSELPALQKHLEALARRQPDQPPATALALLNQYAPAAMLEMDYKELEKPSGRKGAPPLFEVTAVARTRLHRTEVGRGAATAKSKRDAKQLAAARVLDELLVSYDGVQRVAYAEETGERRRGGAKRGAPPRSVADARIDYSRPLEKRFKYGGSVEDSTGVELLPPQRHRWGLGFGPAEAWAAQQELIAPLPEQAAFLGFTKGSQQQQQQPERQQQQPHRQQQTQQQQPWPPHHHQDYHQHQHHQHQPWPPHHHQQQPHGPPYHPGPAPGPSGPPHWDGGYGWNGHPGGSGSNGGGGGGPWGR